MSAAKNSHVSQLFFRVMRIASATCAALEREAPPAYLAGFTPAEFWADADVVLQLRDGARLPAHSQLLASTSAILCDVVQLAVSETPGGGKLLLPFDDFSKGEAVDILKPRMCPTLQIPPGDKHSLKHW